MDDDDGAWEDVVSIDIDAPESSESVDAEVASDDRVDPED
jgi:hypothetical protein